MENQTEEMQEMYEGRETAMELVALMEITSRLEYELELVLQFQRN